MKSETVQWNVGYIRREIAAKTIRLQPDFQRFYIWDRRKEQAFIDSILRNYPIPPIWVWRRRVGRKTVYEIIDGQQRLTCISQYMDNKFFYKEPDVGAKSAESLKHLNTAYFDKKPRGESKAKLLPNDLQDRIQSYAIPTVIISDDDRDIVIDVFKRLNKSSTNLTPQELRNAFYSGDFKTFVYELTAALQKDRFWSVQQRVFQPSSTDRMGAQQFVSDLLVAMMEGEPQDKSEKLDDFYDRYDKRFREKDAIRKRFETALFVIKKAMPGPSRFTRNSSDFYSLFLLVDRWNQQKNLSLRKRENIAAISLSLRDFEESYAEFTERRGKRGTNLSLFEDYRESIVGRQREKEVRELRESILKGLIEPGLTFEERDPVRLFTDEQKLYIWQKNEEKLCGVCEQKVEEWADYEPDHIKAWSRGGLTLIANGQIAHRACNQIKNSSN